MFWRFLFSRIWSSAQDHAVLVLLPNVVVFFICAWPRWSHVLYHSRTSFEGASQGGQPLNIFTWFIGAGGYIHRYMYIGIYICIYICTFVFIYTWMNLFYICNLQISGTLERGKQATNLSPALHFATWRPVCWYTIKCHILQTLRPGCVFSKWTCVFSGIQFTRHFIEFVVVETKQIISSNSHVILTRQTCCQSSGMAAGGKRRAVAFHSSVRICYMFLMSKCRGESDLGLCMTSVLAKRMPLRSADVRRISRPNTFKNWKSALHSGILCASTKVMHRPRSNLPLHFDIRNI